VADAALIQLAAHPALRGVEVRREYAGETAVRGDPQRLEQLLLNLALNAAEAMPEGGTLTLRVRGEGGRVVAEVEDTGVGIPADAVEKVFLPFYSTKPTGTGLGLALAARIVAAHEGTVNVKSEPGRGTILRISLPAAEAPPARIASEPSWQTHASS
jgi:signal transduction histidine kinase